MRRLAWLLVAVAVSCRPAPPDPSPLRFIEKDPQQVTAPGTLLEAATVGEWRFDGPALPAGWTVRGPGHQAAATDRGIELSAPQGAVHLVGRVDLDASAVDAVLVTSHGASRRGPIHLAWARAGDGFSSERSITVATRHPMPAKDPTLRFPLAGHPLWEGSISRLRLSFPPEKMVVASIAAAKETVVPERLAELLRGFKAEVADEIRNVLPAIPGVPCDKPLAVPTAARLRFSYAVQGETHAPVRFAVSFQGSEGGAEELFAATVDRQRAAAGWHQAEVALDDLAGRRGRLRLETSAGDTFSLTQGLPLWGNPEVVFGRRTRPNVVVISVDTLRPDRMSLYGYPLPTTPRLEAWAAGSAAVFRSAVAQSPWTLPSHVSMLTGVEPFRHGVNHSKNVAPTSLVMLAEVLRDAGYRTLAVTGGTLVHPRYGFSQGFDRYWFYTDSRATGRELSVELDRALAWIDEPQGAPFFLFFHTYEVHAPYRSRQPYFERFTDLPPVDDLRIEIPDPQASDGFLWKVDPGSLLVVRPEHLADLPPPELVELASAAYDSGVAYADGELARLLDKVAQKGRDNDTVVVFTSDHGEMLGEHGLVNHRYLYEENILVPLVVAAPGGRGAGRVIPDQVRSIDIVPTVLELAGLPVPAAVDGRSLVPLLDGEPSTVPEEAWTYAPETNYGLSLRLGNRLKYIYNPTPWAHVQDREALYALAPAADERTSLASAPELERLRRRARAAVAAAPGLRLRFENRGPVDVTGAVEGGLVRFNTVKAIDLPCPCLELEPFRARFRVPPGESYTLIIEGVTEEDFILELAAPGGDREPRKFRERITLEEVLGRPVVGLYDSGWERSNRGPGPATRVELWWQGEPPSAAGPAAEADPQLLERLRALGYVQ